MLRQAPTKFCDFHGEAPMAAYFAAQNRNKSSVTLNYTKPEGQERCLDEGHDFGSG
jgi:crotonobetainyl-CoA:carnitine CoA-transferase CaiB-like acyl-CoA transferase